MTDLEERVLDTADSGRVRVLGPHDLPRTRELLDRDPVSHCFVSSRVAASGMDTWRMGGEMWGYEVDGQIESLLHAGANLVPVETTVEARDAFAVRARVLGRRCSSIVGSRDEVLHLWSLLEHTWGRPRDTRLSQPLMRIDGAPLVEPDPLVRRVRDEEIDLLLPAAIEMFTEEVGVSPVSGGSSSAYRARIAEMIRAGRAFARIEDGAVVFKAEIGAATSAACQVQGVWVAKDRRGEGLSVAGMAAVVTAARRDIAPTVSLYVNDFNIPARRSYERVGFVQSGEFATIFF
ncbi:MAG: GNAT family N-acetyltransferase [Actinomycetes bacterium]